MRDVGRRVRVGYVVVLAAVACAAACGKKGAPLAPFVRIPAAIQTIAASRLGNDVYVTLTIPDENIDESMPVDISRVDVYGYTGALPPGRARFAELGTVVASIPVTPPPREPDADGVVAPPEVVPGEAAAGASVTIVDRLSADELVQGAVIAPERRDDEPITAPAAVTPPPALKRFYVAIPFSQRGRPGMTGAQAELVLTRLPDPPGPVRVSYTPASASIAWEPSGGLLGFLMDRSLPAEREPFYMTAPVGPVTPAVVDDSVPPGPTTYSVYRDLAPDPLLLPPPIEPATWGATTPVPINPAPLAVTTTTDDVEWGRERCYTVRARRGAAVSEPSPRTCFVPVDAFPPAAPSGLAAVPSEGGISLIWEPVTDADVAGYLVLRGEAGDATLRQITDTPIVDARYRDTAVAPGTRYIYAVVAVDTRLPLPNVSAQSPRVEETAR